MALVSATTALDEPNSKTDVGDCPTASTPAAEPSSCRGQITHPCAEHQNAGGGAASASTAFSSALCRDGGESAPLRMRMPWPRKRPVPWRRPMKRPGPYRRPSECRRSPKPWGRPPFRSRRRRNIGRRGISPFLPSCPSQFNCRSRQSSADNVLKLIESKTRERANESKCNLY